MDALDMRELLQWLQAYHHHYSGAVRVGDDAARTVEGILGIALWHYQWYILVHAERAGIVDHHGTILGDILTEFLGGACSGRSEGDVNTLEVVVMLKQFHLIFLTAEGVFRAGTTLRAKEH